MSAEPEVGLVLGTIDAVIPAELVTGLDEVFGAGSGGPRTTVPPGAFVFFAFLPDLSWMADAGITFERSLAVRRRLRLLEDIRVGDRLQGRAVITEVSEDRGGRPRRFVTIGTHYERDGRLVLEEAVTYVTRIPANEGSVS
jgi:hypothetical protein